MNTDHTPQAAEAGSILALWILMAHAWYRYQRIIQHFGGAAHALGSPLSAWQVLELKPEILQRIANFKQKQGDYYRVWQQTMEKLAAEPDFCMVLAGDPAYPPLLKQIDQPPPLLFCKGNIMLLQRPQLAVVGSRKPTPTGRDITRQFSRELADSGLCITSGMAQGIDREAHLGALQANGATIAVLGTGLDLCYPSANRDLWQGIPERGGLLVSEFNLGTPAQAFHFPRRNRIVSGMALGTLISEAALNSGSLITARLAMEQNRQVFALPGPASSAQSRGCHALIRDGATLIDESIQILEELNLAPVNGPVPEQESKTLHKPSAPHMSPSPEVLTAMLPAGRTQTDLTALLPPENHLLALYQHIDWTGRSVDELVIRSGIDIVQLGQQLVELELYGHICSENGYYTRTLQPGGQHLPEPENLT